MVVLALERELHSSGAIAADGIGRTHSSPTTELSPRSGYISTERISLLLTVREGWLRYVEYVLVIETPS